MYPPVLEVKKQDVKTVKVKRRMCISNYMQTTFFYLGGFIKEMADGQCSSITKGSIYYPYDLLPWE